MWLSSVYSIMSNRYQVSGSQHYLFELNQIKLNFMSKSQNKLMFFYSKTFFFLATQILVYASHRLKKLSGKLQN